MASSSDPEGAGAASAARRPSEADNDETILKDLCTINGVNYDKLQMGAGLKVEKLEIFFFGFPHIVGLHHFPNLRLLCVVNQKIGKLSGLESCRQLEELWVCEGNIKRIEGLERCTNLVHLYLYTNFISRIEGLSTLTHLQTLWLNGNKIPTIEGLDALTELRDLNLAGNRISAIGRSLEAFSQLEALNLSGNRLSSLKDLGRLCVLPRLHTLSLCDPQYPASPVCRLCNYSTYTLFHLPSLAWLDGKEVSSPELHKLVQGLVLKKKQFYRMKVRHCQQRARGECCAHQQRLASALVPSHSRMRELNLHLKTLQFSGEASELTEKKSAALSQRIAELAKRGELLAERCREACEGVRKEMREECERWMVELESGGNVKFTPGDPTQSWFKSCVDLAGSRFSVSDVQDLGVSGIQVTGVVRVENRVLYSQFTDRLKAMLEKEPLASSSSSSYKQLLDYLFLIWKPGVSVSAVCQDGCGGGRRSIVHMSNSVSLADRPRLQEEAGGRGRVCGGELVLCKVFMGQTAEAQGNHSVTPQAYPGVDCVYRQRGRRGGQREWFVFDSGLVLPEYLIQFHYSKLVPSEPWDHVTSHDLPLGGAGPSDEQLLSMEPSLPARPRLAMLDEVTVLRLSGASSLTEVKSLCLYDNRLSRFRVGAMLPRLVKLILSFNELTSAEDIQQMPNLEFLDLSFNRLTSLEGMKSLPRLQHLDVSWNELTGYHEDLAVLRKHASALETLDARHNPWIKPELFSSCALGRLKLLRELDGRAVAAEEASQALRQVVSAHLSLSTLLSHTHTDPHPPPSLSLSPIAELLHRESRSRPLQLSNGRNDWCTKVTSVSVCGVGLRRLSCLDHLPHLRWLSLADNALTSIEGLSQCLRLEELTLDGNHLPSLSPLPPLPLLTWLSVADNRLSSLPSHTLASLPTLQYLNVSNNNITTLSGMEHLSSLVELYLSGNKLTNKRELFHLKPLSQLVVLDLSHNPLSSSEEGRYRTFAVYHFSSLKALDGRPIDSYEVAAARERLGGRLTQDLIFERHPDLDASQMRTLDLPNCGLKHVDLSPVSSFDCLASLNLEHNSLTTLSGLVYLTRLKVLCLNHNRVESLLSAQDPPPPSHSLMHSLEVLHLAYNGISNLAPLQLGRVPSLRALFLQGNEIVRVEGLQGLQNLTELVLDRNKIKGVQETSLSPLYSLRELHIEENRLRDLSHFSPLPNLERLYLGMNRVQEYSELEKLGCLPRLLELSVISNPVSRRGQHRSLLVYRLPSLLSLDGVRVTAEEKQAANISFTEQQEVELPEPCLPGLTPAAPLKVTNVPFGPTHSQGGAGRRRQLEARTLHLHTLHAFHDRRIGRR